MTAGSARKDNPLARHRPHRVGAAGVAPPSGLARNHLLRPEAPRLSALAHSGELLAGAFHSCHRRLRLPGWADHNWNKVLLAAWEHPSCSVSRISSSDLLPPDTLLLRKTMDLWISADRKQSPGKALNGSALLPG